MAELKIIKALKVLDLTRPEERVDNDGGILAALIYSSLMSAPRNGKAWNRPEYVFSRFVADCARHASFDAIKYPTTRASEGHNLVIINPRYGLRDVGKVLTITTIAEHL